MGAIQNSFNQLLSLGAGAAALGQHIEQVRVSNINNTLNEAEKFNEQANEFNAQHKDLINQQKEEKMEGLDLKQKRSQFEENVEEGKYTAQGQKMLETKYQNAFNDLKQRQLQTTKQLKELADRREILKQRGKLIEKGAKKIGINVKPIMGNNKDLLEKIDKYRKGGKE